MELTFIHSGVKVGNDSVMRMVIDGLQRQGASVHVASNPRTHNVVCWGWRKGQEYFAKNKNVLVLERGYLGDRLGKWTSIGWNGLNGRANFCLPDKPDFKRFTDNFKLMPWNESGDKIIVMGQVMGDMSLNNLDMTEFYNSCKKLENIYDLPVFFRPHPHAQDPRRNFMPDLPILDGCLEDAMKQAFLSVAYNSNSGVDSVINGVPAMSFDEGSMAYEVTSHDFDCIIVPDREAWAAKVAHCQYKQEEIQSGFFWERLKAGYVER